MELLRYYSEADLQAIATQLAVLEVVTYHNAIATGASQGRQKAQEAINWLSRKFANKGLVTVKTAPSLTDQVVRAAEENARKPKNELASRVLSILAERLNCPTTELERLSTLLVREAAEGLDIDQNLLVGQQAEQVANQYWDDCLEGIRKHLEKQNADEARLLEETISERLAKLSSAERLELQKTLQLSDLSGAAVRRAFLQAGLADSLERARKIPLLTRSGSVTRCTKGAPLMGPVSEWAESARQFCGAYPPQRVLDEMYAEIGAKPSGRGNRSGCSRKAG